MKTLLLLITQVLNHITSSLLIKSKVMGSEQLTGNLDKADQRNFYILETDRISHRTLLQKEAKKQNISIDTQQVYSLEPSSGHTLHEALQDLCATQYSNQSTQVNLYPIAIFHGRLPNKERKWLKLLYAEDWQKTGLISRTLQLLLNGRQTLIHIGKPLPLKSLIKQDSTPTSTAHKALRILQTHFQQIRSSTIGPDLSHRRTLISLILKDADVQEAITQQAEENGTHRQKIERHCQTMLNDIAADFSPATTRLLDMFFNQLWKKLYSSVQVCNISPIQKAAQTHQLIYIPCHRSHMDYLLLSWALYRHGLMLPHVAAGDNLNIPVVGPLLKRAGAIFLRRSFNGDKLYQTLYKTYLKHMAHRGHSLEYFIEGGRSRTGRLLPPKTGLLSMSIDTYRQSPTHSVALVPVWISYDRLVESHSYQLELSGRRKEKETLGHLFRSIKILKEKYGHTQLSFGQPVFLEDQVDQEYTLETNVNRVALTVMQNINQAAQVNTTCIIATCILGSSAPYHSAELDKKAESLQQLIASLHKGKHTQIASPTREWTQTAIKMHHIEFSSDAITISSQQKQALSFYRNNIQHLLILPSLYLLLCHRLHPATAHSINPIIRALYPFLQAELFLAYSAKQLSNALKNMREQLIEQKLLIKNNNSFIANLEHPLTSVLIMNAEPVMLRYYSVIRTLHRFNEISYEDLTHIYIQITSSIQKKYGYKSPEYSDIKVLDAFIKQMKKMKLITIQEERLSLSRHLKSELLFAESQKILSAQFIAVIDHELGYTSF